MKRDGALRERELAANRTVRQFGAKRRAHSGVEPAAFRDQRRVDADGVHHLDGCLDHHVVRRRTPVRYQLIQVYLSVDDLDPLHAWAERGSSREVSNKEYGVSDAHLAFIVWCVLTSQRI